MKTDTQREDCFWLNLFGLTAPTLSAAHFVEAAGESGTTLQEIRVLEFVGESYRFRQRMQLEEQAASEQAR